MPQYQGVWNLAQQAQALTSQQWVTDPLFENTTLLLQGDNVSGSSQNNVFVDSSTNNFLITRNGNTTQGTFSPFSGPNGYWGNYFNGATSDQFLTLPTAAATAFGGFSGNITTIEFFVYQTATFTPSDSNEIFATNTAVAANGRWYITCGSAATANGPTKVQFYWTTSTSTADLVTTTGTIPANQWTHVAIRVDATTPASSTIDIYINGIRERFTGKNFSSQTLTYDRLRIGGNSTSYLYGYISNLRMVRAVTDSVGYTGSVITVPTSPLTAVSNTRLLTCQSNRFVDNSTNNFAIGVSGSPSVQAFSPFAPQYQYTPTVTGGSGYFDGAGDYLSQTAPGTQAQFGTSNFTVEGWIYVTNTAASQCVFQIYGTTVDILSVYVNGSTGVATLTIRATNQTIVTPATSAGAVPLNTWNHFAVVRDTSTTIKLYLNGVQVINQTVASTTAFNDVQFSGNPTIGAKTNAVGDYYYGYVGSFRITKNQALATGAFTPPSAPVTATSVGWTGANAAGSLTGTVSLLLNFTNAGIYDATLKNNLETLGNAQVSTAVVKYGSGSMFFNGTTGYLASVNPVIPLTGQFTIEAWVNPVNTTLGVIFSQSINATANRTDLSISSGKLVFENNGSTIATSINSIPTNVWTHIAVTRDISNVLRIFINGVLDTAVSFTGSILQTRAYIGARYTAVNFYSGYIDDYRITVGIARYVRNFTPPQVALPRQ